MDFVEDAQEPEGEPYRHTPLGLRLDWDDGESIHTIYASRRPLGIKHNYVAPIVAQDFTINSYAKMVLRVQEGWQLTHIGGEELHDCADFPTVEGKLNRGLQHFDLWPLEIDFQTSSSAQATVKTVQFTERPLGVEFANRSPIRVRKVYKNSPAWAAGVKEGWFITRIGEVQLNSQVKFKEVITYFQ
eukprot:CAMPEP_0197914346 /NCGR_PEP_ID=MMETSP1439-20131203/78366_1 /TAXON_ID=66791 /ORGANISM="Gonyaulax spinifera, Strain CCMP409" /LENGTH=186 /DNA_ID=CAMNT_0043536255 /DNA_START=66 /DNA_END=623 /DNA_ORIENTATION=-